jgi:hypothetical protein
MIKLMQSWKRNVEHDMLNIFPTFERCCLSNETEGNKRLFINHLGALQIQFSLYFKDTKSEWARDPFVADVSRLTTCEQEQLIHISCDTSFKDMFDADKLP